MLQIFLVRSVVQIRYTYRYRIMFTLGTAPHICTRCIYSLSETSTTLPLQWNVLVLVLLMMDLSRPFKVDHRELQPLSASPLARRSMVWRHQLLPMTQATLWWHLLPASLSARDLPWRTMTVFRHFHKPAWASSSASCSKVTESVRMSVFMLWRSFLDIIYRKAVDHETASISWVKLVVQILLARRDCPGGGVTKTPSISSPAGAVRVVVWYSLSLHKSHLLLFFAMNLTHKRHSLGGRLHKVNVGGQWVTEGYWRWIVLGWSDLWGYKQKTVTVGFMLPWFSNSASNIYLGVYAYLYVGYYIYILYESFTAWISWRCSAPESADRIPCCTFWVLIAASSKKKKIRPVTLTGYPIIKPTNVNLYFMHVNEGPKEKQMLTQIEISKEKYNIQRLFQYPLPHCRTD